MTPEAGRGRPRLPLSAWWLLLIVPFIVPVPGALERMHVLRGLGVLAHFGVPALLVWLLQRRGPCREKPLAAVLTATLVIASCELVQGHVGRHPRWQDAAVDLAGAGCAGAWLLWRDRGLRRWLWFSLLLLAVLPFQLRKLPGIWLAERQAAARFPLLADFETDRELALWGENDGGGILGLAVVDSTRGRSLRLIGRPEDVWPGAIMRAMPRDWSGFRELVFSARLLEGSARRLHVRLDDFTSREDGLYIGGSFPLEATWRTYRLDLEEAVAALRERTFRLDDIDSMLLFVDRPRQRTVVAIDDIHLE